MTFFSRYMGTKRLLASEIAAEISQKKSGPVLDIFSGMSAVGQAVGQDREIWGNDIQLYACEVMKSLFCDPDTPHLLRDATRCLSEARSAQAEIISRIRDLIVSERRVLKNGALHEVVELVDICNDSRRNGELKRLALESVRDNRSNFICSFTSTYGGAYFSLEQAQTIDSIRWAMEKLHQQGEICFASRRRLMICLGKASLAVSNTTGHFAQYLKPKDVNLKRYLSTMSRDVERAFMSACEQFNPVGTEIWRSQNSAFSLEAVDLLNHIANMNRTPGVIYCDPPYTADHYSRYYHVLETLVLADLPEVSGVGLYRLDRHTSQFSIKTKVKAGISNLIEKSSDCGADIIFSYPLKGLLESPEEFILSSLSQHYHKVGSVKKIAHRHSTMGASKGSEKLMVTEFLFSATNSRKI